MAEPQPSTAPLTRRLAAPANLIAAVLVILAVVTGYYFRAVGRNWDDYVQFHPDERFMTGFIGQSMGRSFLTFTDGSEREQEAHCRAAYPDTNGIGPYFDARCSNYNPHNIGHGLYVYGTFPPLVAHWTARLLNDVTHSVDPNTNREIVNGFGQWLNSVTGIENYYGYDEFPLVWRFLSSIYDTITIVFVFLIGFQLRGKWTGVLAAWLYAGAVLPIQLSHYATADPMTAMWVALALYGAVRAQANGKWWEYALFGVAFGSALASRFNVFPLVVSILMVSGLRMLPAFDSSIPNSERGRIVVREFGGLVLAGALTLLVFRMFNPYAFVGPGFFGLIPNQRWLDDLAQARYETSTANGNVPQWQWVGRTPYLFPLWNMVMWGMGLLLGLAAWISTVWATVRIVRGRPNALVTVPLAAWLLVYFGWVGGNFVTTTRYFLPLYAALAVMAAYGLVGAVNWANQRHWSVNGRTVRRVLAYSVLGSVTIFTVLWAAAFTNIYRHQATFTQAGHWVWENLPADFAMKLDGAPDNTPWINIALINTNGPKNEPAGNASQIHSAFEHSAAFTPPQSGTISEIYAPHLGSLYEDGGMSSLRIWISEAEDSGPAAQLHLRVNQQAGNVTLAEATLTDSFPYDPDRVGAPYTITLDPPLRVEAGTPYIFYAQVTFGGPLVSSGALMSYEGSWDEVVPPQVCTLPLGMTLADDPPPGLLSARDCNKRNTWSTIINGYELEIYAEDEPWKRELMLRALDSSDYLIIGTNRRYDTNSRIPLRWPLTNRYYEALFSGELGYELVETFQETFELGPFRVSDQYLPTYDAPAWLNEFEAEEAFHVYDHPVVFIFKRSEDYDPQRTAAILNSVSLVRPPNTGDAQVGDPTLLGPVVWDVQTAHQAPTQLMLSPELWQAQVEGGTWSDRFQRDSVVNTSPVVTVVMWYALVWLLGVILWPVLYRALPALSDRGYALARIAAVVLIAFIAWALSSAHWPLWSGPGLWTITGVLALIAALIVWNNRASLIAFLRENWRLLAIIEGAFAALFVVMLFIRLTNPDLWTSGFGGEKPMNVAYFNGVLRSTVFPPIDPWFAGGFINYYYFGYVIVGVPTLMLGVMPSIAYNLILPMLFAMTGVAAFSIAYSLVDKWRTVTPHPLNPPLPQGARGTSESEQLPLAPRAWENRKSGERLRRPLGNPYIAGVAAMLLAVILGNLDTPRTALKGLASMGGYNDQVTMLDYMVERYRSETGTEPDQDEYGSLLRQANNSSLIDNVGFQLDVAADQWGAVFAGLGRVLQGSPLNVSAERWFWGPSRVIAEANGELAITEMPIFTFIYADLHAHMISMPVMLLVVGLIYNEVALAGREQRRLGWRLLMIAFVGGVVGLFRGINTWDFPTFTAFGVAGLGYAWWLRWRRMTRWSLLDGLVTVGGFLLAGWLAARPYTQWYASTYNSVRPWDGPQTPLWAYLDIHGLFLFLLVSLLVWETARWLRSIRVRDLRGKRWVLLSGALIGLGLLVGALAAAMADYQIALIVVPLLAWIAVLFFRPGQSIPMQFVLVLTGLALALTLAVDVVVLEGDSGRQNTVFKFYIQVWLLFSVAAGAAAAWLIEASAKWRRSLLVPWYTVGSLMLTAAAMYPIVATVGKSVYRLSPEVGATLDGLQFMAATTNYHDPDIPVPVDMSLDYQAITWLQDNVQGSPVIMEGRNAREDYYWLGRISIHTGLPSLLGWGNHQRQQRTLPQLSYLVNQRQANVNYFYTTPDPQAAWHILQHYGVEYVVVAGLERARYTFGGGLDKFDLMVADGWLRPELTVDGNTLVYRVMTDNGPGLSVAAR